LQRALTDFGVDEAFASDAEKVHYHYGVKVPVGRLLTFTLHHANVLASARAAARARVARRRGRTDRR
jgi:hypothetical protein